MRLVLIVAMLLLTSCAENRKYFTASGVIKSISCKNIWRSSNVLFMTVADDENNILHDFKSKLWLVDCQQALTVLKVGKSINFRYENSGTNDTVLVFLKVNTITIVDKA